MIALAFTGGLDSYIGYRWAQHTGRAVRPFHLDLGHPYAQRERAAIDALSVPTLLIDLPLLTMPGYEGMDSHIVPGRNLLIAAVGANFGSEVWLCAVESERHPYANRDKSHEFYHSTTAALSYSWQPMRPETLLVAPFGTATKAEAVRAALDVGVTVDELRATTSCYDAAPGATPCGRCVACFHRWIAMSLNGIHEQHEVDPWTTPLAAAEMLHLSDANARQDFTHYTKRRIRDTFAAMKAAGA